MSFTDKEDEDSEEESISVTEQTVKDLGREVVNNIKNKVC